MPATLKLGDENERDCHCDLHRWAIVVLNSSSVRNGAASHTNDDNTMDRHHSYVFPLCFYII
jgi:hypothetical protein